MSKLSALLLLLDSEHDVADMVRTVASLDARSKEPKLLEIIALDQRSTDNTLSVLSVLAKRVPSLRIVYDVAPQTAWPRGIDVSRGDVLVMIDKAVDPSDITWCLDRVEAGNQAALISGTVLAVGRDVAQQCRITGGLMRAQQKVVRHLSSHNLGHRLVERAPSWTHAADRAQHVLRERLTRLGFTRFDRPRRRR